MKKRWETPKAVVQEFEPNEYVAVCWSVACAVGDGNYGNYAPSISWGVRNWSRWGGVAPYGSQCHDHTGSCSQSKNNQFNVDANGNVSFYAENSSDQGSLNGGYTSYIDNNHNNQVDGGDIIFWYTLSGNSDRRWNHYGTVVGADPSHPNRS